MWHHADAPQLMNTITMISQPKLARYDTPIVILQLCNSLQRPYILGNMQTLLDLVHPPNTQHRCTLKVWPFTQVW